VLGEYAEVLAEQGDLSQAFAISQEALGAGRYPKATA
jgi:hypothetical protein